MRAFLSYSSKDREFTQRLHESLLWVGVDAFFDQRDIKVGDNIPMKIEKGISEASCFIYILSSNSIQSTWVNEELSMAKMKARDGAGYKVLPVLIENVELPTGIAHIRYANFIGWDIKEKYYQGLSELFDGLGVKKQLDRLTTVDMPLQHYDLFVNLEIAAFRYSDLVDGMVDGYFEGMPQAGTEVLLWVARSRYKSFGLDEYLAELSSVLEKLPAEKFPTLRIMLANCKEFRFTVSEGTQLADELFRQREHFRNLAVALKQAIQEATALLKTSVDFPEDSQKRLF
jgi:hypothetical protein